MNTMKRLSVMLLLIAFAFSLSAQSLNGIVIGIDKGHGGIYEGTDCKTIGTLDGGTFYSEKVDKYGKPIPILPKEADICVNIGNELIRLLKASGAVIVETDRRYKVETCAQYRLKDIFNNTNVKLLVSLHLNGGDPTANGTETLYYYDIDKEFANLVNDKIHSVVNVRNRGAKYSAAILRVKGVPSITCESLFLRNKAGYDFITIDANQKKVAKAIYDGIVEYIIKKYPAKIELASTPSTVTVNRWQDLTLSNITFKNTGNADFNNKVAAFMNDVEFGTTTLNLKVGGTSSKQTFTKKAISSAAGDYKITYKYFDGKEWKPIGIQNVTVLEPKIEFSTAPTSVTVARLANLVLSNIVFKNTGKADFNNKITAYLKVGNNEFELSSNTVAIKKGNISEKMTFSKKEISTVAGEYTIIYKYFDGKEMKTIGTQKLTIIELKPKIEFNVAPSTVTVARWQDLTLSNIVLKNTGNADFNNIVTAYLKVGTNEFELSSNTVSIKKGGISGKLTFSKKKITTVSGSYDVVYKYKNGSDVLIGTQKVTIKCDKPTNLAYSRVNSTTAKITFDGLSSDATLEYKKSTDANTKWVKINIPNSYTYYPSLTVVKGTKYNVRMACNCGSGYATLDFTSSSLKSGSVNETLIANEEGIVEENKLLCYPNPASNLINITMFSSENNQLTISDINGKVVYQKQINGHINQQIDVTNWTKGIYLIRLVNSNKVENQKIIVQ